LPSSIKFRLIKFASKDYESELKLRDDTLRKPLGLSLFDEDLSNEKNDYHLGAFLEEQLTGIVILTILSETDIKMRQLGVAQLYRGKNIAKELVLYAEKFASELGYKKIELNARETVVEFYLKLGYKIVGEKFIEVTIPHHKMIKLI
jgi:predicted GNAT family N-acyltransferase